MKRISKIINTRDKDGKFSLAPLHHTNDYLAPFISASTVKYHYEGHLANYINNLNALIKNTPLEKDTIEEIIHKSSGSIYNNASQIFNHYFYFDALNTNRETKTILPKTKALIENSFTSVKDMTDRLLSAGKSLFGSGWVWLVETDDRLDIVSTTGAGTPIEYGQRPLLTIDVWEHAYYLDHPNDRGSYINDVLRLIDWNVVEDRI